MFSTETVDNEKGSPISVFKPVPTTIPLALPAAMFVPW